MGLFFGVELIPLSASLPVFLPPSSPPSRKDVAPADGGPGLPGRRPALPASDGAVEALPGPTLLPLAVRLLVRVPRGGLSPN